MARNIGAVLVGFVVVFAVVVALQFVSVSLYPPPEGVNLLDPTQADAFATYLAALPLGAWLLVFGSEIVGAFLGALAAGKIASRHQARFAGAIVGLAVIGSIVNWVSFSHPLWFIIGQLIAYPLAFFGVVQLLGSPGQQDS